MRLYDAHNHLQDDRFGGRQTELLSACASEGVAAMVVNGSCEEDWPQVLALVRDATSAGTPQILPSFGYHPWYIHERTADWRTHLVRFLDEVPSAIGEIGLDRWKPGLSYDGQEDVFVTQLQLAAERNLPASIHCLQAWGRMLELLKAGPRPARGFLLHSYGGPKEMVKPFADLGAYFSLPGFYAHPRKERQRETFREVPPDRLLIETDAPDQLLPPVVASAGQNLNDARVYPLADHAGRALNHPANLRAVYAFAAELFGEPSATFAARVERNYLRLFGGGK
jgi:TatD DNase family protein